MLLRGGIPDFTGGGAVFWWVEHFYGHDLIGGVVAGVEVVHVGNNPAAVGPGFYVVGKNNDMVFTQWALFAGFAPVLIEGRRAVDGGFLFANGAVGGVFHAVADEGFAEGAVFAWVVGPALQNVVFHQVGWVCIGHGVVVTPAV